MTNYWAIAIGINQYQALQPLLYAQSDAYAVQHFLSQDAHFAPEHCRLLTDTSPTIDGVSTVPVREVIQHHVVQLCQHDIQDGDVLWFFFSGYGVQSEGRDYLLPADGDPNQPIATGIPISELFATLRTAPTPNVVVLLDMKQGERSVGAETLLGEHTLALAREHNLAVFLACQPEQFSHETLALRQGLFTAALLEGLRHHGCITLEHLAQYLSDRLPELSEQHWRPRQNPALFIPTDLRYQLMLPGKVATPGEGTPPDGPGMREPPPSPPSPSLPPLEPPPITGPAPAPPPHAQPIPTPNEPDEAVPDEAVFEDDAFWQRLLRWGGLLIALLLLGVVFRNCAAFQGGTGPETPDAPPGEAESRAPDAPASGSSASMLVEPSGAATPLDLSDPGGAANVDSSLESDFPAPGEVTPQSALESAQQAIATGHPEDALRWLDLVPSGEQTAAYGDVRAEAEQLSRQIRQTNRAILSEAIASMNRGRESSAVNQASDFHRALSQASRIQPGQPLYEEAQTYIRRWSHVILDLAQSRAETGSYIDAIAAAQLVPPNQTELRQMADQWIDEWQQRADQRSTDQAQLEQAQASIRPGQASSYNEAIAQLRAIQPEQPSYDAARAQIDQWGSDILQIAYERAEDGDLYEAINAAALVPNDTSAYLEAQEAISGWRQQLRGN